MLMKQSLMILMLSFSTSLLAGSKPLEVSAGDVITQKQQDGTWATILILLVDTWPDGSKAAHCRTFENSSTKPDLKAASHLAVRVGHAPIDAASFAGWERVGNRAVRDVDLDGFKVYLKHTDFPRYLEVTGQDPDKIVAAANAHYKRGYALSDEGKRREAIVEYSEAIELFPLFYEAIDNRAFLHMELGDYRTALAGFEESLRVEPDGKAAFFSRAECHLRLGEFDLAAAQFTEGAKKFPADRAQFDRFAEMARKRIKP
jgi:tetratricopeptide (TPR) repeat protein